MSFEPLYECIDEINLGGIDWVIVGCQTRPRVEPPMFAIDQVVNQALNLKIPIFLKDNLHWKWKNEFPEEKARSN